LDGHDREVGPPPVKLLGFRAWRKKVAGAGNLPEGTASAFLEETPNGYFPCGQRQRSKFKFRKIEGKEINGIGKRKPQLCK